MTPESTPLLEGIILIIDDSPDNLRVLSKTLTTYGYAVRCVTNAGMAFVSIQNSPPDLILLDIRMPGMNGYEVCKQLKQDPNARDIPVIFLSALDDVEDIVKAFQVGGVDYITKPFQTEEVLARIRNQLTIQKLTKQLSVQNQHLLQEIEERKKFEQALCQEIQRRVLVESSLQDAKNAAEAANYVKSTFLGQMSHELRTPLNAILGFTTLMKSETTLMPQHQEYLTTIDDSARRLLKLINNILTITNSESSQLKLSNQEFDLHQLLDSVVSLWQPKATNKGLQFEFRRTARVPQYVYTDESKLRQILMNLLDNAIQVTERGAVGVKVDIEEKFAIAPETTCTLTIEVQDTGKELAFEDLDTLFQASSQTETNQQLAQELGLSLLLIRQFAQLMGGGVVFKSLGSQGSLVRVHLLVQLTPTLHELTQLHSQSSSYVVHSSPDEGILTVEALKVVMPRDWLLQLHQAAVKGFDHQILSLLQNIPSSHDDLAKSLELWTRNFQFDRIVEITQSAMQ